MLRRATADDGADRLIDAPGAAGDAPVRASADPVAGLVDALREPARPHELDGTDDLVARLAATVRGGGAVAQATPIGRRPVLAKVLTGKVAALAVVALCSAGAAAATGHLPDPVQRRLSDTLSHVGVDLPSPDDAPTATDPDRLDPPTSTPAPGSTAPGSVATGSVATGSSASPDPKAEPTAESVASGASTADADGPGAAAGGVGAAGPTFGARPAPSSAAPTVTTGSAHPSAPGHGGSNPSTAPGHSGQAGDDHEDDPPGGESSHRAHDRTSTRGATPSAVTTTTTTTTTARRRRAGDDAEPAVPSATTAHGRP